MKRSNYQTVDLKRILELARRVGKGRDQRWAEGAKTDAADSHKYGTDCRWEENNKTAIQPAASNQSCSSTAFRIVSSGREEGEE